MLIKWSLETLFIWSFLYGRSGTLAWNGSISGIHKEQHCRRRHRQQAVGQFASSQTSQKWGSDHIFCNAPSLTTKPIMINTSSYLLRQRFSIDLNRSCNGIPSEIHHVSFDAKFSTWKSLFSSFSLTESYCLLFIVVYKLVLRGA